MKVTFTLYFSQLLVCEFSPRIQHILPLQQRTNNMQIRGCYQRTSNLYLHRITMAKDQNKYNQTQNYHTYTQIVLTQKETKCVCLAPMYGPFELSHNPVSQYVSKRTSNISEAFIGQLTTVRCFQTGSMTVQGSIVS